MTDAHCHVPNGETRHFLCGSGADFHVDAPSVGFVGIHPWQALSRGDFAADLADMRSRLATDPSLGVGEIGLDRLKERDISSVMLDVFLAQLALAAEFHRPVVLHGAKCWGKVVERCRAVADEVPAFLFHGFSRSDGLLPDIVKLNGYVSVSPAVLNDHAVNYRELVRKIPVDRLLFESDRTPENANEIPSLGEILAKTAELRGISASDLETRAEINADAFVSSLPVAL